MTATRKAMNAYSQAVETTPPAQQIVMLYDGILQNLAKAKQAIGEGRVNDRYLAVQKASTIIEALQGCLDHENGGDIAPQLDRLYTHFIFRLQAINVENDAKICDELRGNIQPIRDSWAMIAKPGSTSAAPASPQDRPTVPSSVTA